MNGYFFLLYFATGTSEKEERRSLHWTLGDNFTPGGVDDFDDQEIGYKMSFSKSELKGLMIQSVSLCPP